MFTQPATSPTPTGPGNLAVSPVSASPVSTPPSRTSRLRGFSFHLRNYTQTHLLSRDHSSHGSHSSHSSSSAASQNASSSSPPPPAVPASSSAPAADSGSSSNPSSSSRANRLSQLVPALASPLGLPTPPSGGRAQPGPAAGSASRGRSTEPPTNPVSSVTNAAAEISSAPAAPPSTGDMTRAHSRTTGDGAPREGGSINMDSLPSIRFSTFYDPRATRPSLKFAPISRTLPTGKEVIRVGRYSEKDNQANVPPNTPSAAPVGFKSKVVSRRHCEFWYEDGRWYIKDVRSSSGTFLNHIRLSPPGTESKPYPVNDGDIVQLGIDFKGGEEMIFRCVKMRLELNRGWQNKLNTFNMATHKRLRNMAAGSGDSSGQSSSQDCSICLNSIAPCQSLFVAPCSHTWHYKCIRSLLSSPSYPIFICPNCRAAADLEAEVEDPEDWEKVDSDEGDRAAAGTAEKTSQEGAPFHDTSNPDNPNATSAAPSGSRESVHSSCAHQEQPQQQQQQQQQPEVRDTTMLLDLSTDEPVNPPEPPQQPPPPPPSSSLAPAQPDGFAAATASNADASSSHAAASPVPIPTAAQRILPGAGDGRREARTPSPTGVPVANGNEGPITPRNDAGPWVFDGSGVRLRADAAAAAAAVAPAADGGTVGGGA